MDKSILPATGSFSLAEFVEMNRSLLPMRAEVTRGYYGSTERDVISTGDVYNFHFVKQVQVIVIEDTSKNTYNIPLNSSIQFGILFNPNDNIEEAKNGLMYVTAGEIMGLKTKPKLLRATKPYHTTDQRTTVEENELFIVQRVSRKKVTNFKHFGQNSMIVHSVTKREEKVLHSECNAHFTTHPYSVLLYPPEIKEHLLETFPVQAMLYFSNDFDEEIPAHLLSEVVTLIGYKTVRSLIATTYWGEKTVVSDEDNIPFDIPINLDIEVAFQPSQHSENLYATTRNLFEDFNPTRVRTCAQQTFTAVREGHEKIGLQLEQPSRIYEPMDVGRQYQHLAVGVPDAPPHYMAPEANYSSPRPSADGNPLYSGMQYTQQLPPSYQFCSPPNPPHLIPPPLANNTSSPTPPPVGPRNFLYPPPPNDASPPPPLPPPVGPRISSSSSSSSLTHSHSSPPPPLPPSSHSSHPPSSNQPYLSDSHAVTANANTGGGSGARQTGLTGLTGLSTPSFPYGDGGSSDGEQRDRSRTMDNTVHTLVAQVRGLDGLCQNNRHALEDLRTQMDTMTKQVNRSVDLLRQELDTMKLMINSTTTFRGGGGGGGGGVLPFVNSRSRTISGGLTNGVGGTTMGSSHSPSPPSPPSPLNPHLSMSPDEDLSSAGACEENRKTLATLDHLKILLILEAMGLKQYQENFIREQINGEILAECDEAVLKGDLGIQSKLHRMRLVKLISGQTSVSHLLEGDNPYAKLKLNRN